MYYLNLCICWCVDNKVLLSKRVFEKQEQLTQYSPWKRFNSNAYHGPAGGVNPQNIGKIKSAEWRYSWDQPGKKKSVVKSNREDKEILWGISLEMKWI